MRYRAILALVSLAALAACNLPLPGKEQPPALPLKQDPPTPVVTAAGEERSSITTLQPEETTPSSVLSLPLVSGPETSLTPQPPLSADTMAELAAELQTRLAAGLAPTVTPDESGVTGFGGIDSVQVLALESPGGSLPLWAVLSLGWPNYNLPQTHFLAIYTYLEETWQELSRVDLNNQEFLYEGALEQAPVFAGGLWLEVSGVAGAHSGCYDLFKFDGSSLINMLSHCHSSPGAGGLQDVNADGAPEVLLNMSVDYVFCYACAVRVIDYRVWRWEGAELVEVQLARLSGQAGDEARQFNNRAVELAQGELWKEAQQVIHQAVALDGQDPDITWNAGLIDLHANTYVEWLDYSGYPLLTQVFYGDYAAAIELMRPYRPEEIFSPQTPLVAGTEAEYWRAELVEWLQRYTGQAIQVKPDLAEAYFLRAWANFLVNPDDPAVRTDVRTASELQLADPLFAGSAAYLGQR